ncbi:unnamed protein product [Rotaria socialis]|uniref:Uncharacterized protein n=1 Tax=Rotaria socialis TaxID=392032 RepID=A0A820IAE8_9BILA|nr:unnamed protein product [Rotaria socialis]CAF3425459.1 unnamed protein product [Rotaria socialis]CAF3441327.1 unnamed protein product [Rotaria socialis]CAF3529986.1 unnamed protein product [Rotaria socialis]CAF3620207.1 unnamed protein product [Rotaria socialis]
MMNENEHIEQIHARNLFRQRRLLFSKAKLKAVSRTSALLSGFAMIAMVEVSLDDYKQSKTSTPLIVTYAALTCLVVGVHLLALMISTCILPLLETGDSFGYEDHETMFAYIELAWILSTGFGIFLFLLEIAVVCWVKFYVILRPAAVAATMIIVPVMLLFSIFALHFYRRLVFHKLNQHQTELDQIEIGLTTVKFPMVDNV